MPFWGMDLRVLAVTAPQFVTGHVGSMALTSGDPASLQNACRYAADLAENGDPTWSQSNWNASRKARRDSVLLLHDMPHAEDMLARILPKLRPHLVLIGAMSICMPGAIAVARIVREQLGEDVLIVLGGRHASETVFEDRNGNIVHHPASPLRLMASGRIEPIFDIVVAGDGEMVIANIGNAVTSAVARGAPPRTARFLLDTLSSASGSWIAGIVDCDIVRTVKGQVGQLDYATMRSPAELFGVQARFSTFGGVPTAHVFSDVGRGCIYACTFCSESYNVVGKPRDLDGSAHRLYRNLKAAERTIREEIPEAGGASAFCEDSTLLGWNPRLVDRFCNLVDENGLNIPFGGQATVDQIIRLPAHATKLRRTGLEYLFVGVESSIPDNVGGFSKDTGRSRGSWLDRATQAFESLAAAGIKVGISLLFGLGEDLAERDLLFRSLDKWSQVCELDTISLNWAVQHPMQGADGGCAYEYMDWAIDEGPLLDVLRNFGEASTKYTMRGGHPPTLNEARDIIAVVKSTRNRQRRSLVA